MQPLTEQRRLARRCFFISDAPDPELSEFRKVVRRLGRAVLPSDDDVPIVVMAPDPAFVEQDYYLRVAGRTLAAARARAGSPRERAVPDPA